MTTLVETHDLCPRLRVYPALHAGDDIQPMDRLNLRIAGGDHIALQGPSGTGKSVLLRTLALLDAPVRGEVHYRGNAIAPAAVPRYRRAIAYLPQRPTLSGDTVRDALQWPFSFAVHRDHRYDEAAALALTEKAGKPASFLDSATATLSGGESQVAALIRALLLEPEVLLLDEPTAALDHQSATIVEALVALWANAVPAAATLGTTAEMQTTATATATTEAAAAAEPTASRAAPTAAPSPTSPELSPSPRAYVWISHDPAQAERIGKRHWHLVPG